MSCICEEGDLASFHCRSDHRANHCHSEYFSEVLSISTLWWTIINTLWLCLFGEFMMGPMTTTMRNLTFEIGRSSNLYVRDVVDVDDRARTKRLLTAANWKKTEAMSNNLLLYFYFSYLAGICLLLSPSSSLFEYIHHSISCPNLFIVQLIQSLTQHKKSEILLLMMQ